MLEKLISTLPEEKNQLAKKPPLELNYFDRTANFPADNDAE